MKQHILGLLFLVGTLTASSAAVALPVDGTLPPEDVLSFASPEMQKRLEEKKQFILSTNTTQAATFKRGSAFIDAALERHKNLASYQIFDKSHNDRQKRREFTEKNMGGTHFDVKTDDGETISGTFIDNNSDTLLVIGHGFTDSREVSAPLGALFGLKQTENLPSPAYDILLVELRGHGMDQKPTKYAITPRSIMRNKLLKSGVDIDKIRLGKNEHLDVKAAVEKVRNLTHHRHKKTYGYAMCYSTMAFVKAQALFPDMFNKLVLDSAWISIKHLVEAVAHEPHFLTRPQHGGGKFLPGYVTGTRWFSWTLRKTFSYLSASDIDSAEEMMPYLAKVEIPVLFVHAIFDRFTTYANMLKVIKAKKRGPYALLLTPHQHIISHLKSREIMREFCWRFFEDDSSLSGLNSLVTTEREKETDLN